MKRVPLTVALFTAAMLSAAQAQTIATATTDLNIRSGPGPEHPVIGHMNSNQRAAVLGCIEGSLWCQIEFRGQRGWAYSQYMALDSGGQRIVIREPAHVATMPTVTYQAPATTTVTTVAPGPNPPVTTGAAVATGAVAGAVVGGPVGAVVGGVAGAALVPPAPVTTYVTSNPVAPVYLSGDVVVGAAVPETVALRPVPDYRYQYVYVNDRPVLVDPATRRIVYVFR